jgi:uncharacterized protein YebE (UPF0316 family)
MIQIEENKRKIKNKYQALIFSIIVTLLLIFITALNLITEKTNIMNSVLNVLYGFCIGLFTSILLSSIRRLRRGGKNA